MVQVSTPPSRVLSTISSTSLVYDFWENTSLTYNTDNQIYSFAKTLPKEIEIKTNLESNIKDKSDITQIINFEPDSIINSFEEIYEGRDESDLSLIKIQLDDQGIIIEPIILEKNEKAKILVHKEIRRW